MKRTASQNISRRYFLKTFAVGSAATVAVTVTNAIGEANTKESDISSYKVATVDETLNYLGIGNGPKGKGDQYDRW